MSEERPHNTPDDHPTGRIEPHGGDSTSPLPDATAYSATGPAPSSASGPDASETAGSRWSRMRARSTDKPWVPLVAVGTGAAIIGAVVASAVFLANPVHEDVNTASSNSALPASGGPQGSAAPAAPDASGAPAPDQKDAPGQAGPGKSGPGESGPGEGGPDAAGPGKGAPGGPGKGERGPMCGVPAPGGKDGQGAPAAPTPGGADKPRPPAAGEGAPQPPAPPAS